MPNVMASPDMAHVGPMWAWARAAPLAGVLQPRIRKARARKAACVCDAACMRHAAAVAACCLITAGKPMWGPEPGDRAQASIMMLRRVAGGRRTCDPSEVLPPAGEVGVSASLSPEALLNLRLRLRPPAGLGPPASAAAAVLRSAGVEDPRAEGGEVDTSAVGVVGLPCGPVPGLVAEGA
eukprot:CAMPEP_0202923068 /NCGR_PEP_ID=MMETSP1392-20130828/78255_1 /ASSEMBLY_ACC=CAM_ASM_000868 /TAXON_ID=225041 /ORGANISM="Chlamydomonas chlamydogama, Strain SAG 11-48b" /LENGTH=179 /DNA_ID=CAMNT_0049616729 /DNA_START=581 /DNA_END=1121 /DNA_ORIENTATION=+